MAVTAIPKEGLLGEVVKESVTRRSGRLTVKVTCATLGGEALGTYQAPELVMKAAKTVKLPVSFRVLVLLTAWVAPAAMVTFWS